MVKRTKHGPVNAAKVLPPPLVTALQQMAAGRHVYIPALESPAARRWREARQFQQKGYTIPEIAHQLDVEPHAVTRLLASPPPPASRAVAARFGTPTGKVLLRRIQQHVEACVLYVPTAVSKVALRRRRIHRLFTLGWTPARVATHLQMNTRHVHRLFHAWQAEKASEGITVIPGQPLYRAEDRRREAMERDQRHRARIAEQERRAEQARQREVFGGEVEQVSVLPVPLD